MLKNGLKAVCFAAVMVCLAMRTWSVLEWKSSNGITDFYGYTRDSIDVAVFGSSHAYCTVNTSLLWDRYGMAAVNMGESGQNLGSTYYYMKEMLRYHHPRVMLVELRFLAGNDPGVGNGNLYRNTINMKWSGNYLDNLDYALEEAAAADTGGMKKSLLLKFPVFHSRYRELTEKDFQAVSVGQGNYNGAWTSEEYETPRACDVTETSQMDEAKRGWLDKMRRLSEDRHFELIFFVAPYNLSVAEMKLFNAAKEYAAVYGIPFFNFNEIYRDIGFDYAADMRLENHEGSHLNNYGAKKVTDYLGEYLCLEYGLEDHRGESGYTVYDRISNNWSKTVAARELETEEDPWQYISLLNRDEYEFAVVLYSNNDAVIEGIDESYPMIAKSLASDSLYATVDRQWNAVWQLSGKVVLVQSDGGIQEIKVYSDKAEQAITGADFAIIAVDRESGELVDIGKFSYGVNEIHRI